MAEDWLNIPEYIVAVHEDWLRNTADVASQSITDSLNNAFSNNPWESKAAYNPATKISAMEAELGSLDTAIGAFNPLTSYQSYVAALSTLFDSDVFDDTYINADIAAFQDILNDQIETIVLPKMQAGLRDVNAVNSSAFMIAEAIIWGMSTRDTAKYGSELRQKLNVQRADMIGRAADTLLQATIAKHELHKALLHYTIEVNRIGIVALKEQTDVDRSIDVDEQKWDLEVFQYGANLLAAVSSGTAIPGSTGTSSPSQIQSSIGGALAGASAGYAISNSWQGAAIGAAIGLGASFL